MRALVYVALCVLLLSATAGAGELYLVDDTDEYYWYVDGTPDYEVLVPSSAYAYIEVDWGGQTFMEVVLREGGPLLIAGTFPGTDFDRAWQALTARWTAAVSSSQVTTNQTITTGTGLQARFRVLEGRTGNGPVGMVRMVAFVKDGRTAYLLFAGNKDQYAGAISQYWIRAVNSFRWL